LGADVGTVGQLGAEGEEDGEGWDGSMGGPEMRWGEERVREDGEVGRGWDTRRTVTPRFGPRGTWLTGCVFGGGASPQSRLGPWRGQPRALGARRRGGGAELQGGGRCPEVGSGGRSPGAAGREVSVDAGASCGTGRLGRGAGCGLSAAGA
jgi:hypothetical protein